MPLHPFTSFDASTGRPTLVDAEEITFTAEQTRLFFRPHREEGLGNLYVTNQHVIWQSLDHTLGYTFTYPYILLHAVSRDTSSFPYPCLYAQLDEESPQEADEQEYGVTGAKEEEEEGEAMEEEEKEGEQAEEEDNGVITEMRFVPANPQILDALWSAMSACAALNPDVDEEDEDGEAGDFLFDSSEITAGLAAMRPSGGAGGENRMNVDEGEGVEEGGENVEDYGGEDDDGRYEDAEEEEAEEEEVQPQSNSRRPAASRPDDAAQVQQQLASAAAQVQAASSEAKSPAAAKKREREEEEQPAGDAKPAIK